ncbi:MAG TPA: hypothetical protein VFW33_01940, partial [Gemmataceae bacterium]|nr:hypothetical protein [Gemmataceae bacterium]
MKGSREKRSSRPAGSRAGRPAPTTDTTAPDKGGDHPTPISVQCPNPACGKTYTLPGSYAGKDGRCKCGTVFPIASAGTPRPGDATSPPPGRPPADVPRRRGGEGPTREEVVLREREDLTE